jgi:hypothetical protein
MKQLRKIREELEIKAKRSRKRSKKQQKKMKGVT